MPQAPSQQVMDCLNKIFQEEMAGIVRYLHYSLVVMGPHRVQYQGWFQAQAQESMNHAILVGGKITSYGGHPTLAVAEIPETNTHEFEKILEESLSFEKKAMSYYHELAQIAGDDIALEELARSQVRAETEHIDEIEKILRESR